MRVIAVVPVKHTSERVESKNFREFHNGESLLEIKLRQLNECELVEQVYVSSNSPLALDISESLGASFLARHESFCNNNLRWSEVIGEVLSAVPESDDSVLVWAHTTSPFFSSFDSVLGAFFEGWKNGEYDGLVSVQTLKSFLIDPLGNPVNYVWGPWHGYSQNLPDYRAVTGGVFILPLGEARALKYLVSRNPSFYTVDEVEGIDIDTPEDFDYAQFVAERKLESR